MRLTRTLAVFIAGAVLLTGLYSSPAEAAAAQDKNKQIAAAYKKARQL